MDITIKQNKGGIVKTNTKKKMRQMSLQELNNRYNYMKSKQSPKAKAKGDSIQMKYIKFHIKKINTKGV